MPTAEIWGPDDYREAFLEQADQLVLEGIPYIWGGKDPHLPTPPNADAGLDCSGCYCWCLVQAGVVPAGFGGNHNAATLYEALAPISEVEIEEGDAVFYGTHGFVDHVMAVAGVGRIVGSRGGNSKTTSAAVARKIGAGVMYRQLATYDRENLIGFGRMPTNAAPTKETA